MSDRSPEEVLAAGALDATDDAALREVAAFYDALDPVPSGLVDRIQFGITLDSLHAELASLTRMHGELVGARGEQSGDAQTVTFTSARATTMVTVTPISPGRVRIDGWIAPGGGVPVELRTVSGSLTTTADEDGRFVFADVTRGYAQFVLHPDSADDARPIVTPSIEL